MVVEGPRCKGGKVLNPGQAFINPILPPFFNGALPPFFNPILLWNMVNKDWYPNFPLQITKSLNLCKDLSLLAQLIQ